MNEKHGWKIASVLFGLLQVCALFMLTMIFNRLDRIEDRVQRVTERVATIEGKNYIEGRSYERNP